jgi:hypothetical protein
VYSECCGKPDCIEDMFNEEREVSIPHTELIVERLFVTVGMVA